VLPNSTVIYLQLEVADGEANDDEPSPSDSSSGDGSSSSSDKKKKKKKPKKNKKNKKNKKDTKKGSSSASKAHARVAPAKKKALDDKKEAEKLKRAAESAKKMDKLQQEKELKLKQLKTAKNHQEATRALLKIQPLCAMLQKNLMDVHAQYAAAFAREACAQYLEDLTEIKGYAEAIVKKSSSDDLGWGRDALIQKCKDATMAGNALAAMIKSSRQLQA
jgi:hypothetical protein